MGMKNNTAAMFWRVAKFTLTLASLVIAVFLGRMSVPCESTPMPQWPNWPGCQLAAIARYPSGNEASTATVLKRSCNMDETINYFVRLDVRGRRPGRDGWWMVLKLENDAYPINQPTVVWTKETAVQVTVSTRTLAGTLVSDAGDDIVITRVYQPREPGALPNY
jgi:hypothetical protein